MKLKRLVTPVLKTLIITTVLFGLIGSLLGCSSTATSTITPTVSAPATTTVTITPTVAVPGATTVTVTPTQTAAVPATITVTVTPTQTGTPKPANPQLILATTTSTQDTGLLDVLVPMFQNQTGYQVKTIAVGSGAAIAMGQSGQADVLLVHMPDSELKLVQSGAGINRRLVMHNDFVIVGPASDPAGIKGMTDPVEAMKKIAVSHSLFVSRGDGSGTNGYELSIWAQLGATVNGQSWYISTGQGMGATLIIASEKNGYTISDRGTYVAFKKSIVSVLMVQNPTVMVNPYHVIQVNPAMFSGINAAGAQAFSDFMVAPATQAVIGSFGLVTYGQALFIPDAGKTEASLGSK